MAFLLKVCQELPMLAGGPLCKLCLRAMMPSIVCKLGQVLDRQADKRELKQYILYKLHCSRHDVQLQGLQLYK